MVIAQHGLKSYQLLKVVSNRTNYSKLDHNYVNKAMKIISYGAWVSKPNNNNNNNNLFFVWATCPIVVV